MLAHYDIFKKADHDLKIELLDYIENALVIYSIYDGIRHTNNVIRINDYQKEILHREYNKQLNAVKVSTGYNTVEDLLNAKRLEFIQKGYFNDGYTVSWLNNFFFLESFENILSRFRLVEDGQIVYSIENYNNHDLEINESDFIEKIVTAYNGAIR